MGQLYAIAPFTLLDYPGEIACIAWFSGCNLRCGYCHNPDIIYNRGSKLQKDFIDFLERRRGLLTAAVFSGGEATFSPELPELMTTTRKTGYKIKLDTNGTRPEVLVHLIEQGLLDYVALDYKCSPSNAQRLTGTTQYINAFNESLEMLIKSAPDNFILELRTTYHPDLMTENELNLIIDDLDHHNFRGTYYIQNIVSCGSETLGNIPAPSREIARDQLFQPKGFKLSFRNFPEYLSRSSINPAHEIISHEKDE